ncbi:phosphate:H+ symporter [Jimgerdemannia flammicorona]|uniref:Phosphate:H+ symporter n=2 Tax=Jimgerdemannia flammicorona TaxID=994334 RepID=A0A433QLQ0_9FUNG|nr:phosphate:H+ symporter [Jimgerdemannia flammicorona]RUS30701.1 phosphate:H+ symporter [Jimgerdemannia flammicorona]
MTSIPLDNTYVDLDERRRAALSEIDNAKFGWFHIRACIVSGIGFFTDSYDLFAINLVAVMLGYVYYGESNKSKLPSNVDTAVKVAASVGTMVGQFLFGYLADRYGRKKMYGIELIIIIVATIGQSLAANSPAMSVWACIVFWRILLGLGIGGDYPLSAVITSEFATTNRRGAMMAAVFAMQGFGILAAAVVALIILVAYQSAIQANINALDQVWRIVIGLGCVPAVAALYFRLTIPETPRFTMDVERKINKGVQDATAFIERGAASGNYSETEALEQSDVPKASWSDFKAYFGKWENGKVLFGTAYSWFALDVAWYGLGLNNSFVLAAIGFASDPDPYTALFKTIVGNIIINLLGSVPGYWITVFTVEKLGRKPIQLFGFGMLTVLFIILGFGYTAITNYSSVLFIVLFTLAQLFFNFGPNSTTFIVPGEVFPTRYRSTGHGISAASGKFGAILAQVGFGLLKDIGGTNAWIDHLLQLFALFMFTGFLSTFLIPETKGRSLEDLSGENQTDFVRGGAGKAQ